MSSGQFVIRPGDARFERALSASGRVRFADEVQREQAAKTVRVLTSKALGQSLAPSSRCTMSSHLRFWAEFCQLAQLNPNDCFGDGSKDPSGLQIKAEAAVLAAFASFVIAFPRGTAKNNTAKYAGQVIATVRSYYEDSLGCRPGIIANGSSHAHLKAAMKGLRAIAPAVEPKRRPILQYLLRAIKRMLQLESNQRHRVLWAMWLLQWQGCMRAGDLIRGKRESARAWAADKDMHRGRLRVGLARDESGRVIGPSLTLVIKPTKTDRSGEKGFCRTFVLDEDEGSLSAARAVREMLRGDPSVGPLENILLLRDPLRGRELSYANSAKEFKRVLTEAGIKQLASGLHSLRAGGATAYANSEKGGEMVPRSIGIWTSNAKWRYIWASKERMAHAS